MTAPITQKDVAKGAKTAMLARLGGVIEAVSQPAYTLMFGLATYGLYTVLWSLVNLIENIADLGMTSALQRVVPQAQDEQEAVAALRYALIAGVGPCVVIALAASLGAGWLAQIVNVAASDRAHLATGIALFAWALPLWAFVEIGTSAVRARRAFGPEIRLRIFWEQIIRLAVAVALWLAGVDTLGLLIAHLASLTITGIATMRLIGRYYDLSLIASARGHRAMFRTTLLSGIAILPTNIIARLFSDLPPVLLNLWLPGAAGASAAGLYGIGRRLSSIVQSIRMALSYVIGPLASAVAKHDRAAIEPLYAFCTRLSTALALPVAATIAAGAASLLAFFGPDAAQGFWIVVALTIARAIDAIGGAAYSIQIVASERTQAMRSSLIGLAISVALIPLLMPMLGAAGMAVAIGGGLAAWVAASVIGLYRRDGLYPFGPPYGRSLGVAMLLSLGIALTLTLTREMPAALHLAFAIAQLAAALWLSVRFGMPEEDRRAFGKLAVRLRLLSPESDPPARP